MKTYRTITINAHNDEVCLTERKFKDDEEMSNILDDEFRLAESVSILNPEQWINLKKQINKI